MEKSGLVQKRSPRKVQSSPIPRGSHLEELPISELTRKHLQKILSQKSIAHLWLFVSPVSEVATDIARAFLLEWLGARPDATSHPDLLEVRTSGKAGLHSIASIRNMLEQLSLSPLGSTGRAVLIDAADRMAPVTANALLKALEEPPPSTVIILATSPLPKESRAGAREN